MAERAHLHAADESASDPWSFVEKADIERAAAAVALLGGTASALGFGAVFSEFRRLNVPMALLTWEEAARAGALPTIALGVAFFVMYFLKTRFLPTLHLADAAFNVLIGLAFIPSVLFGLPWVFHFPVSILTHYLPWPRIAEFCLSYALLLISAGGLFYLRLSAKRAARGSSAIPNDSGHPTELVAEAASSTDEQTSPGARLVVKVSTMVGYAIGFSVVFFLYALLSLFGTQWFLDLLGLRWRLVAGMSHVAVWKISFAAWVVFAVIYLCVNVIKEFGAGDIRQERYPKIVIALAISVYLGFIFFYSTVWYEHVWSAVGGGQPETLDLWIKAEDFSMDLQALLPANSCANLDKLVRCKGVESHIAGELVLLLPKGRPAIVLRKDSLKVVSVAKP